MASRFAILPGNFALAPQQLHVDGSSQRLREHCCLVQAAAACHILLRLASPSAYTHAPCKCRSMHLRLLAFDERCGARG